MKERQLLQKFSAIKKRLDEYNTDIPIIFNFNFGDIDPIIPIPIGEKPQEDTNKKQIYIEIV